MKSSEPQPAANIQTRPRGGSYCRQCDGDPWCGACYEVKKGRLTAGKSHAVASPDDGITAAAPPSAGQPEQVPAQPAPIEPDPVSRSWRVLYPKLWAMVTQGRNEDRTVRVTSTLTVFLEGSRIKLSIHDRERGLIAFLTVSGLPEGLAQLEEGLMQGTLDWRKKRAKT